MEKQLARFVRVVIRRDDLRRTMISAAEHSHGFGDSHILLDHQPIDHRPAGIMVVAVPEVFLCVDSNGPMMLLVLRHSASVGDEIPPRWPKLTTTLFQEASQ